MKELFQENVFLNATQFNDERLRATKKPDSTWHTALYMETTKLGASTNTIVKKGRESSLSWKDTSRWTIELGFTGKSTSVLVLITWLFTIPFTRYKIGSDFMRIPL